jgi:non-ribosomal peptide synthetase component F
MIPNFDGAAAPAPSGGGTFGRWDTTGSIVDGFLTQAEARPRTIAIHDAHGAWTYSQLLATVETIASRLRRLPRRSDYVLVLADKTRLGVAAMIACNLAGFAWACPHRTSPPAILTDLVRRLRPHALLLVDVSDEVRARAIGVDLPVERTFELRLADPPRCRAGGVEGHAPGRGEDIAYVCFTSGSTSTPKAVAISHRCAIDSLDRLLSDFAFSDEDRVGAQSELSFDLTMVDIFGTLAVGGTIVVIPEGLFWEGTPYNDFLHLHHVTSLYTVPAMIAALLDHLPEAKPIPRLERLILCGETLRPGFLRALASRMLEPRPQLFNLFGATEFPYAMSRVLDLDDPATANTFPQPTTAFDVELLACDTLPEIPLPAGPPTLHRLRLRGKGLLSGAIDGQGLLRPALDPAQYYDTGDCFRPFGQTGITFVGRSDRIIKLRGYSVDLCSLEFILSSHFDHAACYCTFDHYSQLINAAVHAPVPRVSSSPVQLRAILKDFLYPDLISNIRLSFDPNPLTPRPKLR